jgi:hypothetical protein
MRQWVGRATYNGHSGSGAPGHGPQLVMAVLMLPCPTVLWQGPLPAVAGRPALPDRTATQVRKGPNSCTVEGGTVVAPGRYSGPVRWRRPPGLMIPVVWRNSQHECERGTKMGLALLLSLQSATLKSATPATKRNGKPLSSTAHRKLACKAVRRSWCKTRGCICFREIAGEHACVLDTNSGLTVCVGGGAGATRSSDTSCTLCPVGTFSNATGNNFHIKLTRVKKKAARN